MTIVVLVVLVALWAIVLAPSLLRGRANRRSADSIGSFRRQLRVIQRTGPVVIPPANRRVPPTISFPMPVSSSVADTSGQGVVLALGPGRSAAGQVRRETGTPGPARGARAPAGRTGYATAGAHRGAGSRQALSGARARTLQRRRQVLLAILTAVVVTFLLGIVPPLRQLWWVTGMSVVALGAYVALLVRIRNLAAEREIKLTFLPRAPEPEMLLRRSAN